MNNDKIIMGKKVLFTFCIFLVFGIAKSQTYRCVGQYLEAHPYQCDLFVVTDTNNELFYWIKLYYKFECIYIKGIISFIVIFSSLINM